MKTSKLLLTSMLIVALLLTTNGIAQETDEKTYGMAEITYMLPKIGMEKAFVQNVNAHNDKYHKEGPHHAYLDNVLTGKEAGWYVWIMGPCTFTDLDSRPEGGAHDADWTKNISGLVQKYGRTEYWKYNAKLSFKANDTPPNLESMWVLDIKQGDYYRFKSIMSKIQAAFTKRGTDNISVYDNQFYGNEGREVVVVWDSPNWADFDSDDGSIKKEYEEINEEGSWQNMLDEWNDVVESINQQVWKHDVK